MAWFYVLGFGLIAWALLSAGSVIDGGQASGLINWLAGVLAVLAALIAGVWATRTWIIDFIAWVAGWGQFWRLALFVAVLAAIVYTIPALMIDKISAMAVTPAVAGAWVLLPSLLTVGVVPGVAGEKAYRLMTTITDALLSETRWFG